MGSNVENKVKFLSLLLSALLLFVLSTKTKIFVHSNELHEVMHGIGLRSSSHAQNSGDHGEHEVVGQCSPAITYAREQRKVSVIVIHILEVNDF